MIKVIDIPHALETLESKLDRMPPTPEVLELREIVQQSLVLWERQVKADQKQRRLRTLTEVTA